MNNILRFLSDSLLKTNSRGHSQGDTASVSCLPLGFSEWPERALLRPPPQPGSFWAQPRRGRQLLLIPPRFCFNYNLLPCFVASSHLGLPRGPRHTQGCHPLSQRRVRSARLSGTGSAWDPSLQCLRLDTPLLEQPRSNTNCVELKITACMRRLSKSGSKR